MINRTLSIFGILFVFIFLRCASTNTVPSNVSISGNLKAKAEWVKLQTEFGETFDAIYGYPDVAGRHPAVIYNHGSTVRKFGYHNSKDRGYDIKNFVHALAEAGFVAIAPIRKHKRLPFRVGPPGDIVFHMSVQEWTGAVKEGSTVIGSAIQFLKNKPHVAIDKIGIIGFSEGGLITVFVASNHKDLRAVVLLSPAASRFSKNRYVTAVHRFIEIDSPVFLLLGMSDLPAIKSRCTNLLIPIMKQMGKDFEYKVDYPGDHGWFHKIRSQYWDDIIRFLNKKLK